MSAYQQISNTIWNIANHLRGGWKAYENQDVILPLMVLKRLDAALEPTKQKALERYNELDGRVSDLRILRRVTGYDFYNVSQFTFKKLLDDQTHIARNLRKYIDGFSPNIKEIFEKFDFERQLDRLHGSNILYLILQEFDKIDLHPERVPNHDIGLAFEDLIRRFAAQSNETAGEHYTPRDVVRLMTALIFSGEEKELSKPGKVITLYDPACGTGGMLTVGCDYVKANFNPDTKVYLFGQELNSVTYAICKADILLQNEDKDPEGIKGGDKEQDKASTLSNDQLADKKFDYILSNPPYGIEWKKDKEAVEREAERGFAGRFGAGLPRISDGQFLFIQHAISKFKPRTEGGSDAAIITDGSPLFTAGSGESEIRRWILENDFLEAIVAMPEQLFFNTGIATYIWIFSNKKSAGRKNKVQLIDARNIRTQLRRNLGDKRYGISEENMKEILALYSAFKETECSKIFPATVFAYREITVQRPLRLKFEITDESLSRLKEHKDFINDLPSKKSGGKGEAENKAWQNLRAEIYEILENMRGKIYMSRAGFLKKFETEVKKRELKITKKTLKTIWQEIGERGEEAEICLNDDGNPEPDKELKDYERVPWGVDIHAYFKNEVAPYAPDAWIDESVRDEKDGKIGTVGYEIPFTRFFYKYEEPRKVEEIEADIKAIELLREKRAALITRSVTKGLDPHAKLKPSGVEWLGDIPADWETKRNLGLFSERKERVKHFTDEEFELLSVTIRQGVVRQSELAETEERKDSSNDDKSNYKWVRKGDIAYNKMRMWQGAAGESKYEGIVSPAYIILKPKAGVVPRYFHYFYRTEMFNKVSYQYGHGIADDQHSLRYWQFKALYSPLPPTVTQKRIADFLDAETAKIDKAIALIESQIEKLKEYRSSLIFSAVTGKIKI